MRLEVRFSHSIRIRVGKRRMLAFVRPRLVIDINEMIGGFPGGKTVLFHIQRLTSRRAVL